MLVPYQNTVVAFEHLNLKVNNPCEKEPLFTDVKSRKLSLEASLENLVRGIGHGYGCNIKNSQIQTRQAHVK